MAVWAGSFVETHTKNFLQSKLRPGKETLALFEAYGPLSSFAACIGVGYALRLLSKWHRDDLNRIRSIRNHFAHHPYEAKFLDAEVVKQLASLASFDPFEIKGSPFTRASARERYLEACGMLCAQMPIEAAPPEDDPAGDA